MASSSDPSVFRFAPSPNGEMHLGHALSALDRLRAGAGLRRALPGAHRGHRWRPLAAAIRRADLRGPRLARHNLGGAGCGPVAAHAGLSRRSPAARGDGPPLSLLCYARRDRGGGCRRPRRSRWRTALSRPLQGPRHGRDRRGGRRPGSRSRCASTWRAAVAAAAARLGGARLVFTELGEDGAARAVEASPERWGDAVIVRKDVATSYHLAVVVDDAWQGVTHVTRGRDLFEATGLHRLLQVLLDSAGAALPPPSPGHGRIGPQARQERARYQPEVAERKRLYPGRYPPHGGAGLVAVIAVSLVYTTYTLYYSLLPICPIPIVQLLGPGRQAGWRYRTCRWKSPPPPLRPES